MVKVLNSIHFFAVRSMSGDREFSLDHSLGLSEDLGLLFDSGDYCDFNVLVRDSSEERAREQMICAHRTILALYPQFNISTASTNLSVEISQTCHPYISKFFR